MICPYCLANVAAFVSEQVAARTTYKCGSCESEIPVDYAASGPGVPQIVVSLIGKTGHGKSCFLSAFLDSLDSVARANRSFYYKGLDEVEFRKIRQKREQLRGGILPEPTAPSARPSPLLLEVNNIGGVNRAQLMMYDVAGSTYNDAQLVSEKARFVIHSHCVIWLLSISDIESSFDLDEFLSVYLSALAQMRTDSRGQTLVVAITKGDRLLGRADVPQAVKDSLAEDIDPVNDNSQAAVTVSNAIEEWLCTGLECGEFRATCGVGVPFGSLLCSVFTWVGAAGGVSGVAIPSAWCLGSIALGASRVVADDSAVFRRQSSTDCFLN